VAQPVLPLPDEGHDREDLRAALVKAGKADTIRFLGKDIVATNQHGLNECAAEHGRHALQDLARRTLILPPNAPQIRTAAETLKAEVAKTKVGKAKTGKAKSDE
jgi:hypothetical protein